MLMIRERKMTLLKKTENERSGSRRIRHFMFLCTYYAPGTKVKR